MNRAVLSIVAVAGILGTIASTAIGETAATAPVESGEILSQSISNTLKHPSYAPKPAKLVTKTRPDGAVEELWQARGEVGVPGGTFNVATFGSDATTYNYWQSSDVPTGGLCKLMFDTLIEIDPWTAKPTPKLAKSFTVSPDSCEYVFTLRKGLRWSDGKPLTADDVVFTFATVVGKGFGNQSNRDVLAVNGDFPTVEKIDDLTVKFRTKKPFAPFLNSLAGIPIAPKHAMEGATKKGLEAFHAFWNINCDVDQVVVSGPFKPLRHVPGQRIELIRNPNYNMVDAKGTRLPYLERFVIVTARDQNAVIAKFLGGELDFLDVRSVRGEDAAKMVRGAKTGNYHMYNLGPDDGTMFFVFNMNRRKNPKTNKLYVEEKKSKWFNNEDFRMAMNYAIDRPRMIENVLRGVGVPLYGPESPASVFFDHALKPFNLDLKKAKQLLAKAGFKLKDGALYDSSDNRVEFSVYTNAGNSAREAVCVVIKNNLEDLGIKVDVQAIDFNNLIDRVENSSEWDAVVMGLTGDTLEPYSGANIWKSTGRLHMFDQRLPGADGKIKAEDLRDWEKEIDALFEQGGAVLDTGERHKIFDRFQEIVHQHSPFVYLYCMLYLTAMRNTVGNYRPTAISVNYTPKGTLHNIEEIYFKGGKL